MRLCRSGIGDTNGAAGKLNAVEHQVIGLGSDLGLVGFKIVKAFVHGGGEGVVHGHKLTCLVVPVKEGELGYPKKVIAAGDDVKLFGDGKAQRAEHRKGERGAGVGNDEYNVAGFCACTLDYGGHFLFGHEFGKGGGDSVVGQSYPCKTLGSHALCLLGQAVDNLAGVYATGRSRP